MPATPESPAPLRRDAERNRQRILEAARTLFADRGLDVGHDEIARAADVGVGTVYRRFPTKEDLLAALFADKVERLGALADEALTADDPWEGLQHYVLRAVEEQARDRGWRQLVLGATAPELSARARGRIGPAVGALVERAQASGQLRDDVTAQDMALLPMMVGAVADRSAHVAPGLWRRAAALLLDGVRAGAPAAPRTTPLPGRPLTADELEQVMRAGPRPAAAPAVDAT
ncbi:helix-turn-helix domain-containing protein [Pseudokineococcus basanitobsidens]|uniref:Helix-turn-helix domain-containing protein n=1 Tax=Pseudokineococcus basanitobsidens TaxID=1926649 RepID=A0ABU8RMN9_9ACTN